MTQAIPVFKREFLGYFRSPVGYVFLAIFNLAATVLTFFAMDFFRSDEASLRLFFESLPLMFIFFVPAAGMRLWAEERRSGSIELLFTLPLTTAEAVLGKFLAAWAFITLGVLTTFPFVVTVAYLGDPDWGVLFSSYLGTILMAASYLGICSVTSAVTRNQVISFVASALVCLVLTLLGYDRFSGLLKGVLPAGVVEGFANFSFTTHFESMTRGLADLPSLVFFIALTFFALLLNVIVLER